MTPKENTWFHKIANWAGDFTKIGVFLVMISSVAWFAARPTLEPYINLPANQQLILSEQASLKSLINEVSRPTVLDFQGPAYIVDKKDFYRPGETVQLMYFLRRNVTCRTQLDLDFLEVNRNIVYSAGQTIARQAPVTDGYISFPVDILIPPSIPDGVYSYWPTARALECGRYSTSSQRVAPSEVFEVRREE